MNIFRNILSITIVVFLCNSSLTTTFGQNTEPPATTAGDSLSLNDFIRKVVTTYPTVKEAEEALQAADAKIGLAKTDYYPEIAIAANYTRVGPVSAFSFPGFGDMQLSPYDNIDADIILKQRIYDFGKTSDETAYENENKNLAKISIEQVKQKLSLTAINNFFLSVYLQEAIAIKDEQLKTLQEHLNFIEKKEQTGSATQYEILTTKVKISGVESQKLDLEASQKTQSSLLNTLLSEPGNTRHQLKKETSFTVKNVNSDSLLSVAWENRDEMKIAREKEKLAGLHYDVVSNQNNPIIGLTATAGGRNGYEPDIFKLQTNFSAGIGITIPIFDGMRNRNNLLLAGSAIKSSTFQTETARKTILTEVVENEANLSAAKKKVEQFQIQLAQAQKALSLAEVSFKTGAITNLDLLDATTSLSESKLYLLKAGIDYQINLYKLKAAVGERLY
jgi:outer membrane protein TolC